MKECPACRRCFPDDVAHCPQDGDATTPSLHGEPILDARYQLEKRLGQGGMGVVFRARHIFLKTAHAIKVILPDLVGNDPMLVTRFRQEALAAAAIRHQNIIAVTDFGVVRGTMPFLVMEFVNGRSLQDILAEEKVMSPARALEFISAMGAGVAAAHRQNIVHRDLKPLNVMTQEKLPIAEGLKILDFGLAKIKSGELLGSFVQAKTSGLMGSPFYMAPEQWSDDEPDSRADIYSLGIILYQMLSGDVPFKGSSIPSIMKKHLTLPPPSFQSIGMNVPPNVEAVVRHALEKDADARTPTVEALVQEFRNAVNSGGPTVQVIRDTGTFDPNRTVVSPAPASTDPQIGEKTGQTEVAFDSMAGTISAGALGEEARKKLAAEEYERGQEARDKVARDELAREAEARRTYEDESTRKQRQEEERVRKEKEEQEARDRQQREQLDRVAKQARELEERLARLATSMPPPPGVIDPEATQLAHSVPPRAITDQSMASYAGASQHSIPRFGVEQKSKKGPLLLVLAAVLLVLLVGGGIAAYFIMQPGQSSANVNPTPSASPTTTTVPPSTDLVQIPGGTFQMGRNDGPPQEQPEHPVTVQPFLMDRTEVTNNEYSAFVADTNYQAPSHFVRGQPLPGQEQWPVVNVSPIDAQAFAAWRSKRDGVEYRLPTEEEWEYAARSGGEYKLFPWGNRFEEKRAVVKEASPRAVGSYPQGANRWGVLDLIGNVWEWTSSKASLYTRGSSAIPGGSKEWVVARGGSYSSDPDSPEIPVSSTYRDWYDPTSRHPNFGFRLVRSAQ